MKFLLVAINAKYIHSNLAVYSMKTYAESQGYPVELREYTINQPKTSICKRPVQYFSPVTSGISIS